VLIGGGSHRWLALSGRDGSPRGTSSHGRQSQSMHAPLVPAGCLVRTAENHPALMEYTGAHEDDLTAHGQAPPTPPSSSSRRSACGSLPTTARRTRAAPRPCPPSTAPGGRRSSRTAASLCGRATGNTVRTHAGPPVTPTDSLWLAITLPRQLVGGENTAGIPYSLSATHPEWFWPPPAGPKPPQFWQVCWSNSSLVAYMIAYAKAVLQKSPATKYLLITFFG
jgi:hypothetical protein